MVDVHPRTKLVERGFPGGIPVAGNQKEDDSVHVKYGELRPSMLCVRNIAVNQRSARSIHDDRQPGFWTCRSRMNGPLRPYFP